MYVLQMLGQEILIVEKIIGFTFVSKCFIGKLFGDLFCSQTTLWTELAVKGHSALVWLMVMPQILLI